MGIENRPKFNPMENPESPEKPEQERREKEIFFDKIYQEALIRPGNMIEFEGDYTKREFLEYIVKNHDVILHGSNNQGILELEPRQANDTKKISGNRIGVYGTQDEVLPMFHAIKDDKKFHGVAIAGYRSIRNKKGDVIKKEYNFEIGPEMTIAQPWSDGIVYVLPKNSFEQGTDNSGKLVNEWMSKTPVRPIAKLKIEPGEFPYINNIKTIEQ